MVTVGQPPRPDSYNFMPIYQRRSIQSVFKSRRISFMQKKLFLGLSLNPTSSNSPDPIMYITEKQEQKKLCFFFLECSDHECFVNIENLSHVGEMFNKYFIQCPLHYFASRLSRYQFIYTITLPEEPWSSG